MPAFVGVCVCGLIEMLARNNVRFGGPRVVVRVRACVRARVHACALFAAGGGGAALRPALASTARAVMMRGPSKMEANSTRKKN